MRIGILGGSFDPIHFGHLLLAEHCREQCSLDQVHFVPAAISPHKLSRAPASSDARVEMLKLAIAGHEPFQVNTSEVDRGGVSFTVDTIAEIAKTCPNDSLYFLMGADSLAEFPSWREPERICKMAALAIVARPNSAPPDLSVVAQFRTSSRNVADKGTSPEASGWEDVDVTMPQMDISSTEIRQRAAEGRSIRFQTPRAVEAYIASNKLYID